MYLIISFVTSNYLVTIDKTFRYLTKRDSYNLRQRNLLLIREKKEKMENKRKKIHSEG